MDISLLKSYDGEPILIGFEISQQSSVRRCVLTIHNFGRCWTTVSRGKVDVVVRNLAAQAFAWTNTYVKNPKQYTAVVVAIGEALQRVVAPAEVVEHSIAS